VAAVPSQPAELTAGAAGHPQGWRGPDGGARALLLDAGLTSRVGAIDGVDLGRGHVIEVAAALFEVRVLRTGGEVSPVVLLVQIEVRVVRDDQGVCGLKAVAAGLFIGGGIPVAVVPIGLAGALLGEV